MESAVVVVVVVITTVAIAIFGALAWACWYYFKKETSQRARIALGIFMVFFGLLTLLATGCGAAIVFPAILDRFRNG